MPVNLDKRHLWLSDVEQSVNMYNAWFMQFAPQTYREKRKLAIEQVKNALSATANLTSITPGLLRARPSVLSSLRMVTAPPIARDRLIGLADVASHFVISMEDDNRIPPKMPANEVDTILCGYFDTGYLNFAASDGIDWVWEHRVDDLAEFGV